MTRTIGVLCLMMIVGVALGPVGAMAGNLDAASTPPKAAVPTMDTAPTIDGRIDEGEWRDALRVVGLMADDGRLGPRDGTFWLGRDEEHLYIAVRSESPDTGDLLARARPSEQRNRRFVRWDDHLEFWLAPRADAPADAEDARMYRIAVNAHGAIKDARLSGDGERIDSEWRVEWQFASDVHDGQWHVEVAIPLASLDVDANEFATTWGMRVIRGWQQPTAQTGWASQDGPLADRVTMPRVQWRDDGVVVRMLGLRQADEPAAEAEADAEQGAASESDAAHEGVNIGLEVVNRAEEPREIEVEIDHQSEDDPPTELRERFTLEPDSSREITVADGALMGEARTAVRVRDVSEGAVLFSRAFDWRIDRPARRWTAAQAAVQAAQLNFGFYPYKQKLKARLDLAGLSMREAVTGATLTVIGPDDTPVAEAAFPDFVDHRSELVAETPSLPAGTYRVEAVLEGEGVPSDPIVDEFERDEFEWEHNELGITDAVIPPFEPMEVEGDAVRAVLREHVMNDLGLWEQVVSAGEAILAEPMRFEIEIDGERKSVEPVSEIEFTEVADHRVAYRARWRAGSITGELEGAYDYDGMLKIALTLDQDAEQRVDQLDLLVPLREDVATLKHSATTGIRRNFAGYVPDGEGLVWESSEASRRALRGTFIPYIWLGGEKRGVAWFAESDRDWLYDDETSTHRVYREDGRVLLRVSFVTRPAPLERERRIVFGLQATPTKPMPQESTHWRNWLQRAGENSRFVERNYTSFFLAGSSSWGTMGHNAFVYPRDRDYYIYDLMRETRERGQRNEQREAEWFSRHDPEDPRFDRHRAHVLWGLRALASQPDAVVPYTNPRGSVFNDEFITFQDEWLTDAYTSRTWPTERRRAGLSYNVTPTRSYRDYAIWHFEKMLETFADAIYYDCTYLRQNHDLATGAYVGEDGELRPSVDIFNMREHLKRVQTLTWQMDRSWLASISHMTNAQIVPINTWAGVNMEWEMNYGMRNFQDRFSRDQIRTTAIGLQTGSAPQVLGTTGIRGDVSEERERFVRRTLAGVAAVHEIKDIRSARGAIGEVYEAFFDFGYGTEDCRVYRYWDEPFPATIEGLDAEALVLANDGAALLLIVDFDEGGKGTVTLDAEQLELDSGASFVDLESGETLERIDEHAFAIELEKHDFALVGYNHGTAQSE